MRRFVLSGLFAGAAALAAGCNSNSTTTPIVPTGTVEITAPEGGESFQIGETVPVVWTCTDCANVPAGDVMQVYAFDGADSYLVADNGQMSDGIDWVAGSSLQNVSLLPGIYVLIVGDAAGYFQSQSRFFQLVAAP